MDSLSNAALDAARWLNQLLDAGYEVIAVGLDSNEMVACHYRDVKDPRLAVTWERITRRVGRRRRRAYRILNCNAIDLVLEWDGQPLAYQAD